MSQLCHITVSFSSSIIRKPFKFIESVFFHQEDSFLYN
ncbi:hypothetical protein D046_3340 [Vibrio parahaemolyticus V-223/04]|nr:hypothetical protein D046_3340 [Vibrio parahaemolyticus V-223/04]